ncbi:MAG: O-antigen ligase family protein [Actinomycetota bacterium]|nr:O-antigen ligase family protein [Actinomycetota bacterium]
MVEKIDRYSNYLYRALLLLIIVFISSDIFLTIELSGATIRFSYILFFVLFIFWIIYASITKNYAIPVDKTYLPLILFCFVSCLSSLNSPFPLKSLIYSLWTIFYALTIVFLVWFSRNNRLDNLDWMLKVYFYSYFAISIIGFYQFLLPFIIGEKTPFIRQWWQKYTLARINIFSYEPSYFATYMLMGFFIWFILWIRKSDFINYKGITVIATGLIIFLSSSRIGWIGIALIIGYGFIELIGYWSINKKLTKQKAIFFISLIVLIIFGISLLLIMINNPERFKFVFEGTGLFDTSEHSYAERSERTIQTFKVFLDKPINILIGVGPGGAGAYMVNNPEKFEMYVEGFENLWATEPNNLIAELLASVGIVGFIFFLWFIVIIFKRLWSLYKNNNLVEKYRIICLAMFWSLAIELIILQFNQNYLRPYMWLHIGISIALANTLEHFLRIKDPLIYISYEKK